MPAALLGALLSAIVLTLTLQGQGAPQPQPFTLTPQPATSDLVVAEPRPAGYDRDLFMPRGWGDLDRDGCNTRHEVLRRDLQPERMSGWCKVRGGRLHDPYLGTRGWVDAADIDIDHVVALADAWRSGAHAWTPREMRLFANDPENLLATSDVENRRKSDRGPGEYEPPTAAGKCTFARTTVRVKVKYGLTVEPGDPEALQRLLAHCKGARALTV